VCLAVPAKVVEIGESRAMVELGGIVREASLVLVPETKVGDYVLLHAGFAIQRLDEEEAKETLRLFAEMIAAGEAEGQASEVS